MLFHQVVSFVAFYLATSSLPLSKGELVESPHQEKLANIRKSIFFGLKEKDVETIFEKRYGYRKLQTSASPSDMPSKSLAPSGTPTVTSNSPPPTPSPSLLPTSTPSAAPTLSRAPSASPTKKPTKQPTTKKPKGNTKVKCVRFKDNAAACNAKGCCRYLVNKKGKGICKPNRKPCAVKVNCNKITGQVECGNTAGCNWKKNKCKKVKKNKKNIVAKKAKREKRGNKM